MARILIINNEVSSRDFVRLHLETVGYEVFPADDAIAGLRLAASVRPDLILAGAGKPGMDLGKLLGAIRAGPLTAATPVVLLCPKNRRQPIYPGRDPRADDYLAPPVTREAGACITHQARSPLARPCRPRPVRSPILPRCRRAPPRP